MRLWWRALGDGPTRLQKHGSGFQRDDPEASSGTTAFTFSDVMCVQCGADDDSVARTLCDACLAADPLMPEVHMWTRETPEGIRTLCGARGRHVTFMVQSLGDVTCTRCVALIYMEQ